MAPRKQKEELQFFHQLASIAPPMWANFLTACGNGTLPNKVKINNNKIVYRRTTNQQAVTNIPTEISKEELERICNFFQKEVSILIDFNVDDSIVDEQRVKASLPDLLRKKMKLRNMYLFKFVMYYAEKHKLTVHQREQLLLTVVLGTLSGVFTTNKYVISVDEDGHEFISDITNLKVNNNVFYFEANIDDIKPTKSRAVAKNTLYDKWLRRIGRLSDTSTQALSTCLSY